MVKHRKQLKLATKIHHNQHFVESNVSETSFLTTAAAAAFLNLINNVGSKKMHTVGHLTCTNNLMNICPWVLNKAAVGEREV